MARDAGGSAVGKQISVVIRSGAIECRVCARSEHLRAHEDKCPWIRLLTVWEMQLHAVAVAERPSFGGRARARCSGGRQWLARSLVGRGGLVSVPV